MPKSEEKILNGALQIFHSMKEHYDHKSFSKQVNELFNTVEETQFKDLFSLWDLRDTLFNMATWVNKPLNEITDKEFITEFKSRILFSRLFDFYVPIYCLYDFPKNMNIGASKTIDFEDMPQDVKNFFKMYWGFNFSIDTEHHKTKEQYINLKRKTVFIQFVVKANGHKQAVKKAKDVAEDVFHIIRLIHQINFNIIDMRYQTRDGKWAGGPEGISEIPFIGGVRYNKRFEDKFEILTEIFTKTNLNEIEKKILNTVRIFGIQTAITNKQVRFVLLITCLESLLMTNGEKDYLLWKLAEKSAIVLGHNKAAVNKWVKSAYKKRSSFVHGSIKDEIAVTDNDVLEAQTLVSNIVWKIIFDFLKKGYSSIQKMNDVRSINEYVEEKKFGKTNQSLNCV